MLNLLEDLLARQDPSEKHTLLTRLVVSALIVAAWTVLHGFYGLIAAVLVYLLGVELLGLERDWALGAFGLGLALGCWKGLCAVRDYSLHYGHGG